MTDRTLPEWLRERLHDDIAHVVSATGRTIQEMVPTDAQEHLLAARREVLLALTTTLRHHVSRDSRKRSPAQKRKATTAKRPKRVPLD